MPRRPMVVVFAVSLAPYRGGSRRTARRLEADAVPLAALLLLLPRVGQLLLPGAQHFAAAGDQHLFAVPDGVAVEEGALLVHVDEIDELGEDVRVPERFVGFEGSVEGDALGSQGMKVSELGLRRRRSVRV